MDGDGNKAIEFDLLDKKIRRLVAKLKKVTFNIEHSYLFVFYI